MDLGEVVTTERAEIAIKTLDIIESENKELIKRVKKQCVPHLGQLDFVLKVVGITIGEMTDEQKFAGIVKRYNS